MDNLDALIASLVKDSKRQRYEKKKAELAKVIATPVVTPKQERLARLEDPRWRDESLVLIVVESVCQCGARYEAPHPNLFLRRYHPIWGLHWVEAVVFRPLVTSKTYRVERQERRIAYCHKCLSQGTVDAVVRDLNESRKQIPLQFEPTEV